MPTVIFGTHSDGKAISGSNNSPVQFHINTISIKPMTPTDPRYFVDIQFTSDDYTIASKSVV